jgi:hypothetical protein
MLEKTVPNSPIGCCAEGPYLSGKEDFKRVARMASELTDDDWQFRNIVVNGKKHFYKQAESDEDGPWLRLRNFKGACIFLNREDFPTGPGCAFHYLALRTGRHYTETKPTVCWMLPFQVIDDTIEYPMSLDAILSSLKIAASAGRFGPALAQGQLNLCTELRMLLEWDRNSWGVGPKDMPWWCVDSREAYVADSILPKESSGARAWGP